jgi:hypothetical protein
MTLATRVAKERMAWFAFAVLLSAGGYVAGRNADRVTAHEGSLARHDMQTSPSAASAVDAHVTHATHATDPKIPQTTHACRTGAYLEADRILGSVIGASLALPADTPPAVRMELDSILYTGLQQAKSEVHCVAGVLTHGYDRAYAETIEKAVMLARQRELSKDVVALGEDVIAELRANRLISPDQGGKDEASNVLR